MNIPVEIVGIAFSAILGLQGWILREIIAVKVEMARMKDLEKRVEKLEALDPRTSALHST